jgi:hypothetical protein
MTKPIPDKAEVAIEFPDKLKLYVGTLERTARFDAHFDETGISLSLHRVGADDAQKSVNMHSTMRCSPRCCMIWRRPLQRCRHPISLTA